MTSTTTSPLSGNCLVGPKRDRPNHRFLIFVFAVALLVRAGWGVYRLTKVEVGPTGTTLEFPDEQQYWSMAQSVLAGDGFKDELGFMATRMPLYPATLSIFAQLPNGMIAAKIFHWFLGAGGAVLTAMVAASLFDRRVGVLAGLLAAFDPFLVFFSSLLLTETAFIAVLAGLWWLLVPLIRGSGGSFARWGGVGLCAALTVYLRESSLGLIALVLGFIVACRGFDRRSVAGAFLAGAVVVAALLPWAMRNQSVIGQWCWLTTRGGISLYDGVGPQATGASDLGSIKQMEAVRGLDEVSWNRFFLRESFDSIRADPGRIGRLAVVKLKRMWNPLPNVETYQSRLVRFVSAAWTIPIFALAGAGAFILATRGKRKGICIGLFLLLPAVYLTLLHSVFVGSVRYRLGAMPMLEVLSAFALSAAIARLSKPRDSEVSAVGN